jgi:hypothetical protein
MANPSQHFQVHPGENSFRCWSSVCRAPQPLANGALLSIAPAPGVSGRGAEAAFWNTN